MTFTDKRALTRRVAARHADARHEVARRDLAMALARVVTPRVRGRRWIVEATGEWHGVKLSIRTPVLDATDLGVLLALHMIAERQAIDARRSAEQGDLLPKRSLGSNALAEQPSLTVHTSISEIARTVGRDPHDGREARAVRASIERLAMATLTATRGDAWGVTHFVDGAAARGGQLDVALDYRATRAILGKGQWAAVSMRQWREARGDVERVLLHRIAALTTGRMVAVGLDTLAAACWTDMPRTEADRRKRRALVRKAVESGEAVPDGINATIDTGRVVHFQRDPK